MRVRRTLGRAHARDGVMQRWCCDKLTCVTRQLCFDVARWGALRPPDPCVSSPGVSFPNVFFVLPASDLGEGLRTPPKSDARSAIDARADDLLELAFPHPI